MTLLGKIPPQNIEAEEMVLSSILIAKNAIVEVVSFLTSEMFYKDIHQILYRSCVDLFDKKSAIDLVTVAANLKQSGNLEVVGGAYFISQIASKASSASNIQHHARLVQQAFLKREMIRIGDKLVKDGFDDQIDIFDLMESGTNMILSAGESIVSSNTGTIKDIATETLSKVKEIRSGDRETFGLRTGISEIDRITGGFQAGDLVILAGRPGMGKSALALSICRNIVVEGKKPMLFSLEMSTEQLVNRFVVMKTGIPYEDIIHPERLDHGQMLSVEDAYVTTGDMDIVIDDNASMTINKIRARCLTYAQRHPLDIIVVDYMQLMSSDERSGNREGEISKLSRGLKVLAKELKVPVLALSQLNRNAESRADKRPMLSDLRESGAIEQDADIVLFTYRPSYYFKQDAMGEEIDKELAEIDIAKNRNGRLGIVNVRFVGRRMEFLDFGTVIDQTITSDGEELPSFLSDGNEPF